MKATKRNRAEIHKPAEKLYKVNDEAIFRAENDEKKDKERFDKNSLSENDLDTIQAII